MEREKKKEKNREREKGRTTHVLIPKKKLAMNGVGTILHYYI